MPMYDFYCAACQNVFEDIVFNDILPACPACGATETQRRVSAPSQLKTGAFPYKIGPVHPAASRAGNLNMGCSGGSGHT